MTVTNEELELINKCLARRGYSPMNEQQVIIARAPLWFIKRIQEINGGKEDGTDKVTLDSKRAGITSSDRPEV